MTQSNHRPGDGEARRAGARADAAHDAVRARVDARDPAAAEVARPHGAECEGDVVRLGADGDAADALVALLTVMKGLPLAYSKDMQDDKPPVFEAHDLLILSLRTLAGMVEATTFDAERMRQAVELRNASFLWVRDLSQPDTVAHIPGLGWPINILPLIMAGTSFWMTHVTPKSGDATQQRVMMFMPLIFVVFCYNFAAALALYYTTQNLLTVLQLYINRRQPLPVLQKVDRSAKGKRR